MVADISPRPEPGDVQYTRKSAATRPVALLPRQKRRLTIRLRRGRCMWHGAQRLFCRARAPEILFTPGIE
jgi:hypothetical protein